VGKKVRIESKGEEIFVCIIIGGISLDDMEKNGKKLKKKSWWKLKKKK